MKATIEEMAAVYLDATRELRKILEEAAGSGLGLREFRQRGDRALVRAALDRTGGNQRAAADLLGVNKLVLYRLMDTLGIPRAGRPGWGHLKGEHTPVREVNNGRRGSKPEGPR